MPQDHDDYQIWQPYMASITLAYCAESDRRTDETLRYIPALHSVGVLAKYHISLRNLVSEKNMLAKVH